MVVVTRGVYTLKVLDTGVVVELVLHVLVIWGSLVFFVINIFFRKCPLK